MPFKDTLNAGRELVQDLFTSVGYLAGSFGWALKRNGDAEFNNLVARGDITVTANNISVGKAIARLASSGNYASQTTTVNMTTNNVVTKIPFNPWPDVKAAIDAWAVDIADTDVFNIAILMNFQCQMATTNIGSLTIQYKDSTGVLQGSSALALRIRNSSVDQSVIAPWVWNDQCTYLRIKQMAGGNNTAGSWYANNVPDAATYFIYSLSYLVSWNAKIL